MAGRTRSSLPTDQRRRNTTIPGMAGSSGRLSGPGTHLLKARRRPWSSLGYCHVWSDILGVGNNCHPQPMDLQALEMLTQVEAAPALSSPLTRKVMRCLSPEVTPAHHQIATG